MISNLLLILPYIHSRAIIQAEVSKEGQWSDERLMPLTFEKCGVMHCGVKQPNYTYSIHDCSMIVFEFFKDLGIMRSSNGLHNGQCQAAATKASKIFGVIRRIFQRKSPNLLWPAYCSYILPILMYGSQAWNLSLCKDVQCIESVQRRFTKSVQGLHNLSYEERLLQLNALSLTNCKLLDESHTKLYMDSLTVQRLT